MPVPRSLPRFSDSLEDLLLRFDADWNQPSFEQLKAVIPAEAGSAFLLELIRIDAGKRLAIGHTLDEAFYLQAFPSLQKQPELLQKLREITFTPMPLGDSVLRALAATTPVLQQIQLPAGEGQKTTAPFPASSSTLPEHRYKLEGEIARGGMGAVLRGRDEDLGREIAVKVMLQNHAGKTELLQRFVEEAQIAGQLQHPGITPVYELGRFPDQRPYFTMKLVRGQTLAKLLKDRPDPASERSRFLKVFEQICQTLAYAHTRKVIHRDLKPHNIMVGSFGEVQVMDWGLAKVMTAPTESGATSTYRPEIPEVIEGSVQTKRSSGNSTDIPNTQAGSILGTPAYMSPEQARGDIDQLDERADVFGLGTILCEILTGMPPYVGENAMEIYRKSVDADLTDAHARLQSCGADDELITLAKRCLAANRDDRPRDASVLTNELTGYLHSVEDRLKQAELTAVKATTKAEEESKRRKVTFRLAAAILLTLLAGLAGSLWQMQRAITAEGIANENENKAIQLALQEKAAKKQLQRRLTQIERGVELLAGMLKGLNPHMETKDGPPLFEQLRDRVSQASDALEADSVGDPVAVARLQSLLGDTLRELGDTKKAVFVLEKARVTREKELGIDHPDTLTTLNNLALAYLSAGNYSQAVKLLEQVCDADVKVLEANDPRILDARANLADAYLIAGQYRQSITLGEQMREAQVQQLGADHPSTLITLTNLAGAYKAVGRNSDAINLLELVRDTYSGKYGLHHTSTLSSINLLAGAYWAGGQLPRALELFEQVYEARLKKLGTSHPDTLISLNNLAGMYQAADRRSQAITLYEQVRDTQIKQFGADHHLTQHILFNLAKAYQEAGQLSKALLLFEQIRDVQTKKIGNDHPDTLNTLSALAMAYRAVNQTAQARTMLEQVRDIQEKKLGVSHPDTLHTLSKLAIVYQDSGLLLQAIKLLEQVRDTQINMLGKDHPDTLITLGHLAVVNQETGQLPQDIMLLKQVHQAQEKQLGPDHNTTLTTLNNLAIAYIYSGRYLEAIPLLEQVRDAMTKKLGAHHPEILTTLNNLGMAYLSVGRIDDAIKLFEKVSRKVEELQYQHAQAFRIISNTGTAYEAAKQYEQAEAWRRKWLAFVKESSGTESVAYSDALAGLSLNLILQKNWSEAASKLQHCLALREKHQPNAWRTYNTKSLLGGALLGQKKYTDAEPLLVAGYEGMKKREKDHSRS